MLGKTIYLTENPNEFQWAVPRGKGHAFEQLVHKYLKRYVATRDGRVQVLQTRAVSDAGRDFEIRFAGEVELFGLKIAQPTNGAAAVVFVECKSTEHAKLDDAFIIDASQHRYGEACAYVLVTNAVLTPYCQYRAQRVWEQLNSAFHLIDRRKLIDELYLREMADIAEELGLALPAPSKLPNFDRTRPVVSSQTDPHPFASTHGAFVYLAMTNYGSKSVLSKISMATDMQWWTAQNQYERAIMPGYVETLELIADRKDSEGSADLDLTLSVDGRSQRLAISRPRFKMTFEPPFTGETHRHIAQEIRKCAEAATGFTLISIQGEAGVGKTRTVKEGLDPLGHGQFHSFLFNFSRYQGTPSFDEFSSTFGRKEELAAILDPATRVAEMIRLAAAMETEVLIHLEDLHHADESVLKVFKQLVLEPLHCTAPLVLVVTGRDDHTFPNEEYYSFLQLVSDQTLSNVYSYLIPPLTDKDAKQLIRSVVIDMPDPGVERVYKLGQNNPFIIVEVLQYLLDMRLAQLLSRRTVGVLNTEVFAGRNSLPATVEDLYDRRLASLAEAEYGRLASEFLIVASFFDFIIDPEVRRAFFDDEESADDCWSLLCERRFVKEDSTGHLLTFAHENLLHHLRRMVRRPENAERAAALILARPGLAKRLNTLDLGEVYYLHKDYPEAFDYFTEIWERIKSITNFSSEEIKKSYFRYLPELFFTGKAIQASTVELSNVALAYGYMGVHNFPLMIAENACQLSNEMLKEIYPGETEGLRQKLAVRQLRAHALQNMGKTGEALKEMLEIEALLSEVKEDWPELEFDLYDRLQCYYRKTHHEELMRFYGRQASKSVKRAGDEKLRAAHLITQSVVCLFGGEREARKRAAEAYRVSQSVGVRRFILYTHLTELIVESLYSRQDRAILNGVYKEARKMLRHAAINNFSDSIMRLELLLGTLALNCYEDPVESHKRARFYIKSGQANSIRFGNGLFDWAFDNLSAVIALQDQTDEVVLPRFRTCLEKLKRRGLTFMGAEGGTYPNSFAISNIVRYFGGFHQSDGVDLIRSVFTAYDNSFLEEHKSLQLVTRAVKGRPIFWPEKSKFQMMRYPLTDGYFTPIF